MKARMILNDSFHPILPQFQIDSGLIDKASTVSGLGALAPHRHCHSYKNKLKNTDKLDNKFKIQLQINLCSF